MKSAIDRLVSLSGKGLYPRDRILSATSSDGIEWRREAGARIDVGFGSPVDMAYYPFVVSDSKRSLRMYFYGSNRFHQKRKGGIYSALSVDGLHWRVEKGLRMENGENSTCKAPVLVKIFKQSWRMYFVEFDSNRIGRLFSAISKDGLLWNREKGVRLSPKVLQLQGVRSLVDASFAKIGNDGYRLYFSALRGPQSSIYSAVSEDGLDWKVEKGERIANQDGMWMTVNNPCVIKESNSEWRMYFRGGNKLALENALYMARSKNGIDWTVLGKVLAPSKFNPYERHGLGFPFILPLTNGESRIYYTGYWGNIWREKRVVSEWEKSTLRAKRYLLKGKKLD